MSTVQVINPYPFTSPTRNVFALALPAEGRAWNLACYPRRVLGDVLCLDVRDSDGAAVVLGVAVVAGVDLLAPYRAAYDVPRGTLWAARTDGRDTDPTPDDFARGRAVLYYIPPEGA